MASRLHWSRSGGVPVASLGLLGGAPPGGAARAADFAVESAIDAGDAVPGDGFCASAVGDCTLRAAIEEANAVPGADTVTLPSGLYELTLAGAGEDLCASGDLDVLDDLAIAGAGAEATIVDGGRRDRVFHVANPGAWLELSGITVRNGSPPREETAGGGGALNLGRLTLVQSAVVANSAELGGGISNLLPSSTLALIESSVSDNESQTVGGFLGGGGIGSSGTLLIFESTVSGNRTLGAGGGIGAFGTVELYASTVSGNTSAGLSGGGITHGSPGTLKVTNSTISGNRARGDGGGIANTAAVVTLNNVTIHANTADSDADGSGDGGGVRSRAPIEAGNTVVAGNTDTGGQAADCSGPVNSAGHNLIGDPSGCVVAGDILTNTTGRDPRLGPLADNGGATDTHALLLGSPAIDAGSPGPPLGEDGACEPTDQRGVGRPLDGNGDGERRCDIGSYEVAPAVAAGTSVTGHGSIEGAFASGAAFAFHVETGSPPSGVLRYDDGDSDEGGVRIRADAIDVLVATGSGAEFAATAMVNGSAKPIRVTVEDRGEPGTGFDTFAIEILEPGGYANGPRTLVRGNIQLHE